MTTNNDEDLAPTEGLPGRRQVLPGSEGTLPEGHRIGHYRIEALLGRGGMGEVYRAGQLEPIHRTVALKLLHSRRLDARHLAYFEVEQQLLAQMKHPAIAQVFDAGTTVDGQPYFAMEYIEGSPLNRYCDHARLGLRERLALFIRICEGVQHAHQKGVIHRDLKPGNILVTEVDGRAMPKIIDFGIATAATRSLAVGDAQAALERAGTPDYMSPEQAGLAAQEVDTRSDVYSLGIVLYELIAGRRPDSVTSEAARTASLTLRAPSEQIATLSPVDARVRAEQMRVSPPQLRRVLRRELDWVVMKAIRRDRNERYSSAAELADDLRRFLDNRPLSAVPPRPTYVLGKYIARHRLAFASATAIALAVLAGLALSVYGLQQAQAQRRVAEARQAELEQVAAFQQSMLEGIDIAAMGQALLDDQRAQLVKHGASESDLAAFDRQAGTISWTDIARGNLQSQVLERALAAIDRDFAAQPALAADLRESIAGVLSSLGLYPRAVDVLRGVAAQRERSLGAGHSKTLRALRELAIALSADGKAAEAGPLLDRAGALAATRPAGDDERLRIALAHTQVLYDQGDMGGAKAQQQALYDTVVAARGANDELALDVLGRLATTRFRTGDVAAALKDYETIYAQRLKTGGIGDERTQAAMADLARARGESGDFAGSLALSDQLIKAMRARLGAEHPDTLAQVNTKVVTLIRSGRLKDAVVDLDALVDSARRVLGPTHPRTLRYLQNQASLRAKLGDYDQAIKLQEALYATRRKQLGDAHPDVLISKISLASMFADAGRIKEAIPIAREGCGAMVAAVGEGHRDSSGCFYLLGDFYLQVGDASAAVPNLKRALAAQESHDGPDHARTIQTALALDEAYRGLHDAAASKALRERLFVPFLAQPLDDLDEGQRHQREDVAKVMAVR